MEKSERWRGEDMGSGDWRDDKANHWWSEPSPGYNGHNQSFTPPEVFPPDDQRFSPHNTDNFYNAS
jgi:hypothetical protein